MPVVPRSVSPIADPTPYQREQAHHFPGAFGRGEGRALAGVGRAIDRSAGVATDIVLREQDKDNDREAKEMDVRLVRAWREKLYGDNGFYNQQGTNAVAASGNIKQELEKITKDIRSTASNPVVGEVFSTSSAFRLEKELETVDRYTSKERTRANLLASEARAKEAIEDAMLRWNDPTALTQAEHILKHEILDQAEIMGWEPEVAQSKLEEGMSSIYLGAVEMALANGSAAEAKTMFSNYKDKVDAPAAAKIANAFKQAERSEAAEARSIRAEQRSIIAFNQSQEDRKLRLQERIDEEYNRDLAQQQVNDYMDLNLTYEEAKAEASKITDVELRDEVERRMDNAFAKEEKARALVAKETGRKLNEAVANGATYDEAIEGLSEAEQQHAFANPELITKAQDLERRVAEDALFANATDGKTYAELKGLPASDLAEVDTNAYLGVLTRSEHSKLINDVAGARRYMERSDDVSARILNNAEGDLRRDLSGNELFFDGSKPTPHFNRVIDDLRNWVYDRVDNGKPPLDKEVKQKAAQLTTTYEGDTAVWLPWGNFRATARDLTDDQKQVARMPLATIPTNVLSRISIDITNVGVKVQDIPDSVLEELAAAFFLNQRTRYERILSELQSE